MTDLWGTGELMVETCGVSQQDNLTVCENPVDCTEQELETRFGCMTCEEAHQGAGEAISAALTEAGKCDVDEDCTLTFTDTNF